MRRHDLRSAVRLLRVHLRVPPERSDQLRHVRWPLPGAESLLRLRDVRTAAVLRAEYLWAGFVLLRVDVLR